MEEHKIPTLTLTPDLDAAQPAAKEPDLLQKAEAAPEAGPDLSMLSPEEQQAVTAFAGQLGCGIKKLPPKSPSWQLSQRTRSLLWDLKILFYPSMN